MGFVTFAALAAVVVTLSRPARAPDPDATTPQNQDAQFEIDLLADDNEFDTDDESTPLPPPPNLSKLSLDEVIDRLDDTENYTVRALAFREVAARGPAARAALPALRSMKNEVRTSAAYWAALAECLIDPDRYDAHLSRALARVRELHSLPHGTLHSTLRLTAVGTAPGLAAVDHARRNTAFELLSGIGCLPSDPTYPVLLTVLKDPNHPGREQARELLWSMFVRHPDEVGRVVPAADENTIRIWSQIDAAQAAEWVPLLADRDRKLAAVASIILVMAGKYEQGLPTVLATEWPDSAFEELRFKREAIRGRPEHLPRVVREFLGTLQPRDREKVRTVAAAALRGGKTAREKKAAIQVLQYARTADADTLAPAFADPDPAVQRFAVREVLTAQRPPSAFPLVATHLLRTPDEFLAQWFDESLQNQDDPPPAVADFVTARVLPPDGKPGFSRAFRHLPTTGPGADRTAELVIRYLSAPAEAGRLPPAFDEAAALAGRLGPAAKAAVPFIRPALTSRPAAENGSWHRAFVAADTLLRIVPNDADAIATLLAVIDARTEKSYQAVQWLGKIDPTNATVTKLISLVEAGWNARFEPDRSLTEAAVEALAELGPRARAALPVLRRCAGTPFSERKVGLIVGAMAAVGRIDQAEQEITVRRLAPLLTGHQNIRDPAENPRFQAAKVLITLGPAAKSIVPELITFAQKDGGAVSGLAAGLARLAPERCAEVLNLFADGYMLELPGWVSDKSSLQSFAAECVSHPAVPVRRAAWNVLISISPDPASVPLLRAVAAAEKDPGAARRAAAAFARSGFTGANSSEGQRALAAWVRVTNRRLLPRRLARIAEREQWEGENKWAGWQVEMIARTDPHALRAHLTELFGAVDKDRTPPTVALIKTLARAAPDSIGPLIERLDTNHPPNDRVRAALALGRIGPKADAAVHALTKALDDRDRNVRYTAAEVLLAVASPVPPAAIRVFAEAELEQPRDEERHLFKPIPIELRNAVKKYGFVWNWNRLTVLRSLGAGAAPAAKVLGKHFDDPQYQRRIEVAEILIRADPNRAEEVVRWLLERATYPYVDRTDAAEAIGRLDASARPAAKWISEALAAHPNDDLTAVLARALRRTDPAAARAAGVR
ncbi:hypothetical protein C1280_04840 [Gemmata obscuriglobus]|uniref:HEAT repeat domain-containing protein n=1 Tax=Gemmata obscuriglobus TaxID=114 RepID=A0A2Z3GRK8_9BACT|nr:hypothetical protein C1280_04840 [Gemmata obscuriglobus]